MAVYRLRVDITSTILVSQRWQYTDDEWI